MTPFLFPPLNDQPSTINLLQPKYRIDSVSPSRKECWMMSWLRSWFSSRPATPAPRRPVRRVQEIELLEGRVAPAGVLAVGSGGYVQLFHDSNNHGIPDGAAYATLSGGDHVAVGHFTSVTTLQVAVAHGSGSPVVKSTNSMPTMLPPVSSKIHTLPRSLRRESRALPLEWRHV
jgi:hypothetical protein